MRGARPQGHRTSHCLQLLTPLPFQHIASPPLVTQEGYHLKAFAHLPTVAATPPPSPTSPAARADHLGLSRRSPAYKPSLSLDDIDIFIWDPVASALRSPTNEELEVLDHVAKIRPWREGRLPHWCPSTSPRSTYTVRTLATIPYANVTPFIVRCQGQATIAPIRSKPSFYHHRPNDDSLVPSIGKDHTPPLPPRPHRCHAGTPCIGSCV